VRVRDRSEVTPGGPERSPLGGFNSALDALLASHYRLRFHPQGLTAAERLHLRQQTEAWLRRAQSAG